MSNNVLNDFNKQARIKNYLVLMRAKACDKRLEQVKLLRSTTTKQMRADISNNIRVLNHLIDLSYKLINSKQVVDTNKSNHSDKFIDMIITGNYKGEQIIYDVKNAPRIKTISTVELM